MAIGVAVDAHVAEAQLLSPKRVLTVGPAPGCAAIASGPAAVARRDNVEARRLAAAGQEAALIGDQAAARTAFIRAAELNPGDERVAYDLARAHEELADTSKAIAEYCRYLTLSPGGREATDVRGRLSRIVPRAEAKRADDVQVAFRLGLALFDDGRYDASARAFTDVVRNAPTAAEALYNRGLARAAAGQRAEALTDLEQFRAAAPTVDDRVEVARAIERLRRPVYSAGAAFGRGLLPGFGQFYTSRPVRGVLVLLLATGSAGAAFVQKTTTTQIAYIDPNGVSAPYSQSSTERPYFAAALGSAVGITLVAAIEAAVFANGTQNGASIIAPRGTAAPAPSGFAIGPTVDRMGHAGLRVRVAF
jgi:tetratricopeptide (TPR) repeat protein